MKKDNLKKDCERKARECLTRAFNCGWVIDEANLEPLQEFIAEALISEHLIVQKRVEMDTEKLKQGLKRIMEEAETIGQAQWFAQVTLEDL